MQRAEFEDMPFGILEDRVLPHVPGTVHLEEKQRQESVHSTSRHLKHGTGRDADIVLAPQPSDDPNDPLNWSYTRKVAIVAILMFGFVPLSRVCTAKDRR